MTQTWYDHLSESERVDLRFLESQIETHRENASSIAIRRKRLIDRAIQRMRRSKEKA